MAATRWMLYGANGYTGELIAREAARRGEAPLLAGRNAPAIARLGSELGLETRTFGLGDVASIARALGDCGAVLNCAGPFAATAAPMIEVCLVSRVNYLDITGEIDVLETAHARDAEARARGVVLCPGAGFDVVPTDCLAAELKKALPDATYLALGFDSRTRPSRGTALTNALTLASGGRIRSAGRIRRVAHAFRERSIDFGDGPKAAVTIPWGDVSTAWHTTGIPNIEVYAPMSPARIASLRRLGRLTPLLRLRPVQSFLEARISRGPPGPDAAARAATPTFVWGEVQAPSGELRTARIRVANGYDVTVHASLGLLTRVLEREGAGGYFTPSQLAGSRFVETLEGSGPIHIESSCAWEPRP
jgi:short subunit dehydrogenase-like uncharacterized protein